MFILIVYVYVHIIFIYVFFFLRCTLKAAVLEAQYLAGRRLLGETMQARGRSRAGRSIR